MTTNRPLIAVTPLMDYGRDSLWMLPLIRMLGNFERPLRPFADAVNQSFNVIENMGTMTAALQNQLDRIPR